MNESTNSKMHQQLADIDAYLADFQRTLAEQDNIRHTFPEMIAIDAQVEACSGLKALLREETLAALQKEGVLVTEPTPKSSKKIRKLHIFA